MKFIETLARKYLNRKQKVAQEAKKRIDDKKLEEAGDKLKALYEFVRFINEKCLRNRRERKTFWKNVSEGHPLVEETIVNVLRKMGVKEESIKEITDAKIKAQAQREGQEAIRKLQAKNAEKTRELSFIKDGVCINNGDSICNLGYACDGCPYNHEKKATKKQMVEKKEILPCADGKGLCDNPEAKTCDDCDRCGHTEVSDTPEVE